MTSENYWERPHSPAIRTKMAASNMLKILQTKPNISKTKNIRRKLIPVPKSQTIRLTAKQVCVLMLTFVQYEYVTPSFLGHVSPHPLYTTRGYLAVSC